MILTGCSTGYVLAQREKPGIFSKTYENSPIAATDGVALLYDREPLVLFKKANGGDVTLYYRLVIKNAKEQKVTLKTNEVRLEGEGFQPV